MLPKSIEALKKLISIFFLLLFLFNVGGYYMVYLGFRHQARKNLLHRLDTETYTSNEITLLTIPLTLPYPVQEGVYERVNGEFEYKGAYYKLIKQKLEHDTLFIACYKDTQQKKIEAAMADYTKLANDVPTQSKQALNFLAKFFKDFNASSRYTLSPIAFQLEEIIFSDQEFTIIDESYPIESPPPEHVS
jgi:hypothetical protein